MEVAIAELTRPETNADRDFLPRNWCGSCQEAYETPVSSADQHLKPGWALAAVRDAVRDGRLDFQVTGLRPDLANPEIIAAVEAHRARPTKYERRLSIPPLTAHSHERGTPWRQHEMCRAQWAELQLIRERDRERRARQREHDVAVERELQTLLTTACALDTHTPENVDACHQYIKAHAYARSLVDLYDYCIYKDTITKVVMDFRGQVLGGACEYSADFGK